jgi:hypothetical protein
MTLAKLSVTDSVIELLPAGLLIESVATALPEFPKREQARSSLPRDLVRVTTVLANVIRREIVTAAANEQGWWFNSMRCGHSAAPHLRRPFCCTVWPMKSL